MAEGSIVFISDELINKMMKADHLITDMATKSEQAQARIVAAFKKMGDEGVGHFIQKLHEAQAKINALSGGSINIKATGLENISSQAAKSADDVNKLYEVITKLAEANENLAKKKNTSKKDSSKKEATEEVNTIKRLENDYDKLLSKLAELRQKQRELAVEQYRSLKSGQTRPGLKEDIDKTAKEIEVLNVKMRTLRATIDGLSRSNKGFIEMANNIGKANPELSSMSKRYAEIETMQKDMKDASNRVITERIKAEERYRKEVERLQDQETKDFQTAQKEKAKIAEKAAKEYEQAYLKADEDLIKSSDKRMRQVIEQINKEEEARRKSIQSQQASQTTRTTTSYLAEYGYNLKRIEELNDNMQKLIASTKQYELIKNRIDSGKGGAITRQQTEEYNANLKNIDAIKQQIATYRQRNQTIVDENHAIQAQIRFKQEMQNMSAKDRESAEILAKMGEYYRQQAVEAERLAKAKNTTYADAMQYSTNAKTYIEEKQAIEQLTGARNNLSKNDADFAAKRNALTEAINRHKESLKQSGKTDSQIAEEAKQAAEKRRIAAMRETEAYERRKKTVMDKWYSSSADRALNFSASTKTINEQIQAIKYLQIARSNLSKGNMTDEQYRQKVQRITEEIKRQREEIEKLLGKNDQLANSHRNLMDISGQLARRLALIFSVSQITGYMNKLVAIRGEFEIQQKSLQVLLQNRDEANKLWQQTVDLAVRSPFRVSELVSYTRQLAAYRIETDKLHETTKRLADVSAGLGVDMNRLILAYGQVRAAEYLRGTELRQFTEAGIPMLDELAKRFTGLEGKAVSAGDVFERISKRMVSFEDVAAVFERMTSAGGAFYKMQEEQSNTLKGMISNLHDSIDLMLNDIGKTQEGVLKGSVNVAKFVVEHWEGILYAIKAVLPALALYRLSVWASSEKLIAFVESAKAVNTAMRAQVTVAQILQASMIKLKAALVGVVNVVKANPIFLAVTAVAGAIYELYSTTNDHSEQLEKITERYSKLGNQLNELTNSFRNAVDDGAIEEQKKKLQSLIDLANGEYHMNIKVDVQGLDEKELLEKLKKMRQMMMTAQAFSMDFETRMQKATELTLTDDILEDMKQLGEESEVLQNKLVTSLSYTLTQLGDNFDKLTDQQKKAYETLRRPIQPNESGYAYLQRLREGFSDLLSEYNAYQEALKNTSDVGERTELSLKLTEIRKNLKDIGIDAQALSNILNSYQEYVDEANKEFGKFLSSNSDFVNKVTSLPEEQRTIVMKMAIDKIAAQQDWNSFTVDYIQRWTEIPFVIKFIPEEAKKEDLKAWQDTYNKRFAGYEGFVEITKNTTKQKEIIDRINASLTVQKALVERIAKAGTGKRTAYEGMNLAEEQKRLKQLKEMLDWLEGKEKGTEKQGKDWFSELARNIKDAHKEFVNLNEDLDKTTASMMMAEKYKGVFRESIAALQGKGVSFDIAEFDLTTETGTESALQALFDKVPESAREARLAVEKALTDIRGEITIESSKNETENLVNDIKRMIDGYKLSVELEGMGVTQDLAEQMFGVQTFDLEAIKKRIANEKDADKEISKERMKQLESLERQIEEMEDKARMDNLNKYTKYLLKSQSERVRIKLEEARRIAEIEKLTGVSDDAKRTMMRGVQEETQAKMDKQAWSEFKDTAMYVDMFKNLDAVSIRTLKRMKAELESLRSSMSDLSSTEMKEIVSRMNEIDSMIAKKNPFDGLASGIFNAIKATSKYKKAQDDVIQKQADVNEQQAFVDNLSLAVEKQKRMAAAINKSADATSDQKKNEDAFLKSLEESLVAEQKILGKKKAQLKESEREAEEQKSIVGLTKEKLNEVSKLIGQQLSALNDIKDSWASVFGGMSDSLSDAFDSIQEIGGGVSNIIQGISQGPAGYLQAAAGIFQTIGGIFNIGDKRKERQIKKEQKLVEDLERSYEKLEKAIEDAYSLDTLKSATKMSKDNINAQIRSYQKMIATEEDKKKTDQDRIKEWKNNIEDLKEQLKELDDQAFSTATGGILDNVLDASKEWTDAWFNAFAETGKGMTGLEDNFKEMMQSILRQQAAMTISNRWIDGWKRQLEQYVNADDMYLTTDEAKRWADSIRESLPGLNNALEAYFNAMKEAGIDISNGTSNLSGLSQGISQASEETMLAVEGYLNSIRFFVSEQNNILQGIAVKIGTYFTESPMLSELRSQTELIKSIRDMFGSVIKSGHPTYGGSFLKVAL